MVDQARRAAQLTSTLDDEVFSVLAASASLLPRYESIPTRVILAKTGMPERKLRHVVELMIKNQLCVGSGPGIRMTMLGLDVLALHELARASLVTELGPSIGVGKESDVYETLSPRGPMALKFFRLGRISFRELTRKRRYAPREGHRWLVANIRSARQEGVVLQRLGGKGLPVPAYVGRRYHTLLMKMELGIPLYRVRKLDDADEVLRKVLDGVRSVYQSSGLVNSDLSEFNVLVTPSHDVILIDWPQAIRRDTVAAEDSLRRDVANIVRYFARRYRVKADPEESINYVKGLAGFPALLQE